MVGGYSPTAPRAATPRTVSREASSQSVAHRECARSRAGEDSHLRPAGLGLDVLDTLADHPQLNLLRDLQRSPHLPYCHLARPRGVGEAPSPTASERCLNEFRHEFVGMRDGQREDLRGRQSTRANPYRPTRSPLGHSVPPNQKGRRTDDPEGRYDRARSNQTLRLPFHTRCTHVIARCRDARDALTRQPPGHGHRPAQSWAELPAPVSWTAAAAARRSPALENIMADISRVPDVEPRPVV